MHTFQRLSTEANAVMAVEPALTPMLLSTILNQDCFESALIHRLAARIAGAQLSAALLRSELRKVAREDPAIAVIAAEDLMAIDERDPAWDGLLPPFLYAKGYHALQAHRFAHAMWLQGRRDAAITVSAQVHSALHVDIHPGAQIGRRVMIDHGTGIVVGETARIGDDVSLLQEVTLGGSGDERGLRHPRVGDGVLLGAGAEMFGNISIGKHAKVGAGSVVFSDVPPASTAVGNPARVVERDTAGSCPGTDMIHNLG